MVSSLLSPPSSAVHYCVIATKKSVHHEWKGGEALQLVLPQWRAWWILQVTERNVHIVRVYLTVNHLAQMIWAFAILLSMQLSQLEDPRRPGGDLSSVAQVCLQHLWSYWWCCPHPQVSWLAIKSWSVVHYFVAQVLSLEQGWCLQLWSKSASAQDQEKCCWQLLLPQVDVWVRVRFDSNNIFRMLCHPLPSSCRVQDVVQSEVMSFT